MNALLLARQFASEDTINDVQLYSIIAIAVLVVVITIIAITTKSYNTKSIVYGAMCIAASFALSFIKIAPVTYGGSITLASFVPILIYAYCFGLGKGLLAGIIFGILNFIQSPYILVPETFLLDYILAFASIGLMGLAPKFTKNLTANVLLGVVLVYAVRFLMHFISGLIYFKYNQIWVDLPQNSAAIYSFLYQTVYIIPDMIIALAAFYLLSLKGNLKMIIEIPSKK